MFQHNLKLPSDRIYGLLVDEEDCPSAGNPLMGEPLWGIEYFGDGMSQEKPMCEIIITAANHAADPPRGDYPGGLRPGGPHFTWYGPKPFEEPRAPNPQR